MDNIIRFPALGIELNPPRIAFEIFGRPIYFYGIIISLAFLVAALYCFRRAKSLGVSQDDLIDAVILAVPLATVCARLYYVIFSWDDYASNPIRILYIWEGGVAIYGGIIGAFLGVAIISWIKKQNPWNYFDIGALGFLIGQAIGRWGNFINREAYGTVTDLPWGMEIYDYMSTMRVTVHPTFLYESLWNIIGFVILHFRSKHRKFRGEIFLWYLVWYGIGRAIIEGLRTDSLFLFSTGIRVSQFVGIVSAIVGGILLFYNLVMKPHDQLEETEEETEDNGTDLTDAADEEEPDSDDADYSDIPENNSPDPDAIKDDIYPQDEDVATDESEEEAEEDKE